MNRRLGLTSIVVVALGAGVVGGEVTSSLADEARVEVRIDELRNAILSLFAPAGAVATETNPNYKGAASLFLLISKMTTDKVLDDLKGMGGTVIKTSSSEGGCAKGDIGGPRSNGTGDGVMTLRPNGRASGRRKPGWGVP